MRKLTWIAVVLALIICFMTACGGKNAEPAPTPSPTPSPTEAPTPTPTPEPVAFETVVAQRVVNCAPAADTAAVYDALASAWAAEEARLEYGGDHAVTAEAADGALTLYGETAAVYDAAGTPVSDGTHIYMLSGTTLQVLRADGANSALLNSLEVGSSWSDTQEGQEPTWGGFEKYPSHLYLAGDKLAILSNWYGYEAYMQDGVNVCDYTEYTCVDIYDLTDPVSPVLTASFGQDGVHMDAQVVDGVLCLATQHLVYSDADAENPEDFMPRLYTTDGAQVMEASQVILTTEPAASAYALVGVYDLNSGARVDAKALLGINGEAVMDGSVICLTAQSYATALSANYRDNIYDVFDYASVACTDVYCLELAEGALTVKATGSVEGHPTGDRATTVLGNALHLATRTENFRYTLYADMERGFENILWGDMESGENFVSLSDQLEILSANGGVFKGYLFNWSDGSYLGLAQDEAGALRLSLLSIGADGKLTETAGKSFGSDYSKTLSSSDSIYVNSEKNVIGFAADDGYSFYSYDGENGFVSLFDAYITDWPWHVRCAAAGDYLYMTDRTTVYVYSLTDMALVHTMTL